MAMAAVRPDEENKEKMAAGPGVTPGPVQQPETRMVVRDNLAKGMVMFVLAVLVLIAGGVGYITYDEYVSPNLPIFICCVPSVIIASLLLFFGVARRWAIVRQVNYVPVSEARVENPGKTPARSDNEKRKARKIHASELGFTGGQPAAQGHVRTRPISSMQINERKKHIKKFLKDLDDQFKDGLLTEDSYRVLKNKNMRELHELEKFDKPRSGEDEK